MQAAVHEMSQIDGMDEDVQAQKYLTFILAEACYGIDISHVTEIIGLQKITSMPDVPSYIRGVINLRGNVIPVMDVRARFGLGPREYDDRTCIIVIDVNGSSVGLVVDTVSEVLDIPLDCVQRPPTTNDGGTQQYISGLGKINNAVKVLLDAGKLIGAPAAFA